MSSEECQVIKSICVLIPLVSAPAARTAKLKKTNPSVTGALNVIFRLFVFMIFSPLNTFLASPVQSLYRIIIVLYQL